MAYQFAVFVWVACFLVAFPQSTGNDFRVCLEACFTHFVYILFLCTLRSVQLTFLCNFVK